MMVLIKVPLKNESERGDDCGSKGMTIHNKNIVAHSSVEGNLGDDVHSGIAKLQ